MKHVYYLGTAMAAAISLSAASANENITYSYDSEGRLVTTSRSGTVNNGVSAQQSYDRADNRTNLTVSGSANGSPGGGNNPPVAVNDAASLACNGGGGVNVTANDSDPDGHPLTVTAVSLVSGAATIGIAGPGLVNISMNSSNNQTIFSYTISDGNGGTATAQIIMTPSGKIPSGGLC
jgi:hypothetical protein